LNVFKIQNGMTAKHQKTKATKTVKGDQTKALILETALDMFRERGYDETTMRAVAQKAGVSLGNAYYYFRSKEYLIQAFYQRVHDSHMEVVLPALEHEKNPQSTPADHDANEDRHDEAVSPVCGRAFQDGGESGKSVEPFRRRIRSGTPTGDSTL
jgi:AcrR family transcriptional regulator